MAALIDEMVDFWKKFGTLGQKTRNHFFHKSLIKSSIERPAPLIILINVFLFRSRL